MEPLWLHMSPVTLHGARHVHVPLDYPTTTQSFDRSTNKTVKAKFHYAIQLAIS